MKINVSEAQLKTASVEVRVLTLSGKQVTLAVFRQLKDRELININNGELNGVPWGTVNYHPDKCGDELPHLHVVWEKDGELLRSAVYRSHADVACDAKDTFQELCPAYLAEMQLRGLIAKGTQNFGVGELFYPFRNLPDEIRYLMGDENCDWIIKRLEKFRQERSGKESTFEELEKELTELAAEVEAAHKKYRENYEMLSKLDQLFIAV